MADDITGLLELCTNIEEKTAELYFCFSDLYREMPDLSRLMRKTAQEEENHMLQFQLAAKLKKSCNFTATVSLTQAQQAFNMIAGLLEKVRERPPTWRNALKFAIELENRMAQFHTNTALVFEDDSFNSLCEAMMRHDQDHVVALSRYLEMPTDQEA
jgi:hypothetical protein